MVVIEKETSLRTTPYNLNFLPSDISKLLRTSVWRTDLGVLRNPYNMDPFANPNRSDQINDKFSNHGQGLKCEVDILAKMKIIN